MTLQAAERGFHIIQDILLWHLDPDQPRAHLLSEHFPVALHEQGLPRDDEQSLTSGVGKHRPQWHRSEHSTPNVSSGHVAATTRKGNRNSDYK